MLKKVKRILREWLQVERGGGSLIDDAIKNGLKVGERVDFVSAPNFGSEPYLISIGDDTTISFDCAFVTHDAATRVIRHLPDGNPETGYFGPIVIGKNCFIGCRTTILANVHIGDNTVIGACSLVNGDIPSGVVAAGVPCKILCTLDEYREKHKEDFKYMNSLPYKEKKEYLLNLFKQEMR